MDRATDRSLRVRLLLPIALVGAVVVVGTLGYYWLWRRVGGTWMDALFMTVTTITTIGGVVNQSGSRLPDIAVDVDQAVARQLVRDLISTADRRLVLSAKTRRPGEAGSPDFA